MKKGKTIMELGIFGSLVLALDAFEWSKSLVLIQILC